MLTHSNATQLRKYDQTDVDCLHGYYRDQREIDRCRYQRNVVAAAIFASIFSFLTIESLHSLTDKEPTNGSCISYSEAL